MADTDGMAKKVKKVTTGCCAHLAKVNNFAEFFASMACGLHAVEGLCCVEECSARAAATCIDCPVDETTFCLNHMKEHYEKGCAVGKDVDAVSLHAVYALYEPLGGKHKVYCALCDIWVPYGVVQKKCGWKRRNPFAEDMECIKKTIHHHAIKVEDPVTAEPVISMPLPDSEQELLQCLKQAPPEMRAMFLQNGSASMVARLTPFLPTEFIGQWSGTNPVGEVKNFAVVACEEGHRYHEKIRGGWLSAFLRYRVEVRGRHYFSGILMKHKNQTHSCGLFLVNKQPVEIRLAMSKADELILRSSHVKYAETVCQRQPMVEVKPEELPKVQSLEYIAGNERLSAEEVELVAEIERLPHKDKETHLSTLSPSIQARIRPFCSPIVGTWEVDGASMTFGVVIKSGFAQFVQAFPGYTLTSTLQYGCQEDDFLLGPITIQANDAERPTLHLDKDNNPVYIHLRSMSPDALKYSYGSSFETMQSRVAKRVPKLIPSCAGSLRNTHIPSDNMSVDYVLSAVKCTLLRNPDFANDVVRAVKKYVDEDRLPTEAAHHFRLGFFN
eukprot:GEMP01008549.1.p1 GENE.GEMP01008549.1~~GEMP01008549.1.p1  ORF type:complete len:555 (+),score=136.02 GEMP01008549.1:136-1800(+)